MMSGSGKSSPKLKPASQSGCCCGPSTEWQYPEEGSYAQEPQNSVRRQYQRYKRTSNVSSPPADVPYPQFDYQSSNRGYRTEYVPCDAGAEEDFAEPQPITYCTDYDEQDDQEEVPTSVVRKTRRVRRRIVAGDEQMPIYDEEPPQVQEESFVEDIPTECGTIRKITNRRTSRSRTKIYCTNEDEQPEYYEEYNPEPEDYTYEDCKSYWSSKNKNRYSSDKNESEWQTRDSPKDEGYEVQALAHLIAAPMTDTSMSSRNRSRCPGRRVVKFKDCPTYYECHRTN